jgi:hypothetical protein
MADEGHFSDEQLRPDIIFQKYDTVMIIEMKYSDNVVHGYTQARYYRKVWEDLLRRKVVQRAVNRYIFVAINVATTMIKKNFDDVQVAYNIEDATVQQKNFKTPEKIKKNKTHIALRKRHPGIRINLSKS